MSRLQDEIARFDATIPIEKAWTPPSSWYTDPDIFRLEQQAVFGGNWLIAARTDQVDAAGKYVCGEVAGERYVIVRGGDGRLRAFYNVCRHHAAAVAEDEGTCKRFSCPYHGWTYDLDGALLNAPETEDVEDFDRARFGLSPMAVETWGPLVFIAMTDNPRPLATDLGPLKTQLNATGYESLRFVERRVYTMRCNWKVYVDNYLDGGYHVAYLHRGLAAQLDLQSYRTEIFERFSVQSGGGAKREAPSVGSGSDFAERIGEHVVYAWIHPNLMINRYGPIMDTNWVLPLGPDRTQVIFDYYFAETHGTGEFVARSISASDVVQDEDAAICEAVQQGLLSRSYDRGRYSAVREMGEHHFHRLLAAELSSRRG